MRYIELSQEKKAIVDDLDYELVNSFKWSFDPKGYAFRNTPRPNRKILYLHRFLLGPNTGEYCDHINGDKLDNRRENLRICTNAENIRNRKIGLNNTSGFKGISWNERDQLWYAHVTKDGKSIYAGCAKTKEEAAKAYNDAAIKYHGEFAKLNII